jgi:methylmalonyl-CoA/ethylmalonyl-CoA epimerase
VPAGTPRPLHHIGVVVADFAQVHSVLGEALGLSLGEPERYPEIGIEVLWADAGGPPIEFIRPIDPDSRAAALLAGGGGGVHHIAFAVPDLDAAMAEAVAAGIVLRDEVPRPGTHGSRIAFLEPSSTGGALIELIEPRAPATPDP